jgi:hypothetical protein
VTLAARGARNLDRGEEKVGDPEDIAEARSVARRIYVQSALVAVLVTALGLLLPS